jgi:hypothetical protein
MPEATGHTVIILGAGASADYGLPIGSDLRRWILDEGRGWLLKQLNPRNHRGSREIFGKTIEVENLEGAQLTQRVDSFIAQFGRAGHVTIDDFLGNNPDLSDYGRLAIVGCLLHAQDKALAMPDYSDGCYGLLSQAVSNVGVQNAVARLRVVNFNYDRTFPMMLATMLASMRHTTDANSFVTQIDSVTVHPYGNLGLRYGFDAQRHVFRPMHTTLGSLQDGHAPNDYIIARNGIRIIERKEDAEVDAGFSKARDWLSNAKAVYFLGFGFDSTNLARLGFDGIQKPCKNVSCTIYATTYGLRQDRRNEVSGRLSYSKMGPVGLRLGEANQKCYDFLAPLGGIQL